MDRRSWQVREFTMFNALAKIAGYTTVFVAADTLVPSLYGAWVSIGATVVVLMLIGLLADLVIVPILGPFVSLVAGYPAMVVITWYLASWQPANHVTWLSAIVIGLFLGPWEFMIHKLVIWTFGRRVPL